MKKKLPKEINPCPIIEALVEIKFDPSVPEGAVFGEIYSEFKDKYTKVEQLFNNQIPQEILEKNPLFSSKPFYKLSNAGDYVIQIGPNVFNISTIKQYKGWNNFKKEVKECLEIVQKKGIVKNINSIALRYINFFDVNIFENIEPSLIYIKSAQTGPSTIARLEIIEDDFLNILQVANPANFPKEGKIITGSCIDIETHLNKGVKFEKIDTLLEQAHNIEKQLFFDLLTEEFIHTLNPNY